MLHIQVDYVTLLPPPLRSYFLTVGPQASYLATCASVSPSVRGKTGAQLSQREMVRIKQCKFRTDHTTPPRENYQKRLPPVENAAPSEKQGAGEGARERVTSGSACQWWKGDLGQSSSAEKMGLQLHVSSKGAPTKLTTGSSICPQQEKGEQSPCQGINCLSQISFQRREEIYITEQQNISGKRDMSKADPGSKGHQSPGGVQGAEYKEKGPSLALHSLLLS